MGDIFNNLVILGDIFNTFGNNSNTLLLMSTFTFFTDSDYLTQITDHIDWY